MKIKLDYTKSAQENGNEYYKRAKRLVEKRKGALNAIKKMEKELSKVSSEAVRKKENEKKLTVKKIAKREWYEKFHWGFTSDNIMIIGGRDAHENELLNSRHFTDKDLFFHANIHGASLVLLKEGIDAQISSREEAAQFAASYSSAWKEDIRTVDVYAMRRDQVSKSTSKGSLGTGSFLLSGEREWYRNTQLGLAAFISDNKFQCIALKTFDRIKNMKKIRYVIITQGNEKKSDAAKRIAKILDYDYIDYIMMQLPTGMFELATYE